MLKQITPKRLYNIALHYLSKYSAGHEKVRKMLIQRVKKTCSRTCMDIPIETNQWIEDILTKLTRLGYLNDKSYTENQVRTLSDQGKSTAFIRQKLIQNGIGKELVSEVLNNSSISEEERATRYVCRKKIGWLRDKNKQSVFFKKDLSSMARAGFSYAIAKKALTKNGTISVPDQSDSDMQYGEDIS